MCVSFTNLIAHDASQGALTLSGDPPSDTAGSDLPGLGDHQVAGGVLLVVVVQDELGQQGRLPTASGSPDDHHGVVLYQRD